MNAVAEYTIEVVVGGGCGTEVKCGTVPIGAVGSFSVSNWQGYPASGGVPPPNGPFRVVEGQEYAAARSAANRANQAMHRADPSLAGKQIHEIHPVKFGGSPTDPANKVPLTPQQHAEYTMWWNRLLRDIQKE